MVQWFRIILLRPHADEEGGQGHCRRRACQRCAGGYVARMEKFVRVCIFLVELAVKALTLGFCFFFGSFAFIGFWGEHRFRPEVLPLTAFCAAFAYLMVVPRRWMPARWLRDVSCRRIWCVSLAVAAPLYVSTALNDVSALLLDDCVRMLPIAAILFAVLETRWGAQDRSASLESKIRCVLLPLALWLGFICTTEFLHDGPRTWLSLILAVLAAYWWTQDPSAAPASSRLRVTMMPPALWLGFIGIVHLLGREGMLVWFYYLLVALVTAGFALAYWLMLRRDDSTAHARESA